MNLSQCLDNHRPSKAPPVGYPSLSYIPSSQSQRKVAWMVTTLLEWLLGMVLLEAKVSDICILVLRCPGPCRLAVLGLTDQQLHQRVSEQRYVRAAHVFEMMVRVTRLSLLTLIWIYMYSHTNAEIHSMKGTVCGCAPNPGAQRMTLMTFTLAADAMTYCAGQWDIGRHKQELVIIILGTCR